MRSPSRLRHLLPLVVVVSALGAAPNALAAPPNDSIAGAEVVTSLPFRDKLDITTATVEAGEPASECTTQAHTVWYRFTPAVDTRVFLTNIGSNFAGAVAVYTGLPNALDELDCWRSARIVNLTGGTTYHFRAGSDLSTHPQGGTLAFGLFALGTPSNDDFDNAVALPSLPFVDAVNPGLATSAGDDRGDCGGGSRSVWYTFTNDKRRLVSTYVDYDFGEPVISVFTGSRGALTKVACLHFFSSGTFTAQAGTTYHVMVRGEGTSNGAWPIWFGTEKFEVGIVLRADKRRLVFGKSARLTVDLGQGRDADNDRVSIYLKPRQGPRVRVASGDANSNGVFTKTIRPSKSGYYEAEWAGDDRYDGDTSGRWAITVIARMAIELRGAYGSSGGDKLYRAGSRPVVFTKVAPNQAGRSVFLLLQMRSGSRWRRINLRPELFRLGSASSVVVRIGGLGAGRYRAKTICQCPNVEGESRFAYFRMG
jgi:hypothetical protein